MPKKKLIIGYVMAMLVLFGLSSICLGDVIDAAPYLRMGAGARAIGMGGAFTAVADDATAVMLNPAGLPNVIDLSLTLYTSKMSHDRKHNFIGFAKKLDKSGTLGLAWVNAGVSDISSYDDAGNIGERFNFSQNALVASYGYATKDVSFGGGLKILLEGFDMEGSEGKTGFGGIDLGVLKYSFENTVSYGLAIKNLGGKIGEGTVPMTIDLGVAYKLVQKHQATLAFDIEHQLLDISENTTSVRIGAEYWLANTLAFRAGGQHSGDRRSLFAGFGVKVAGLQVDYAFKPTDDAANTLDGNSHFVSLSYAY